MVFFSKLLKPITLGLATWATIAYAAEEIEARFGDLDVTLVKGTVQGGSNLTERSVPPECSFNTARGDFSYVQIKPASGTACVGWDNWSSCGAGRWADPDWTDLQTAMAEIVAMDGQWSSSQAGAWKGTFWLGTTAFDDRNTQMFDLYFAAGCEVRPTNIYWSRNGNFATIIGHEGFCS